MRTRLVTVFSLGFFVSAVLFIAVSIVLAWTGPTSAPPNNNVSPPLNVGTTDQIKDAGLGIDSLAVFGNAILNGASRYLNFGVTSGSTGYGIRDNAGTMEFKSSGGSWQGIASTSAGSQTSVDTKALAKAWVNFSGQTGVIRSTYNITSVTPINYAGFGNCMHHLMFSQPMVDANYVVVATRQVTQWNSPSAAIYSATTFPGYGGGQTANDFYLYTGSSQGCDVSNVINVVVYGN